jgi:CubicO group peptidase (beta-lactamase class C family)
MTGLPIRAITLAVVGTGIVTAQSSCHDLQSLQQIQLDLLAQYPARGSSCLRVDQRGITAYEQAAGTFTLQEVVPIASATKTLSAAVLLSLVDSGHLGLDDRVGQYLPEWNVGAKASITLRMCFTHTSGLPGSDPAISDDSLTLRQAAQLLASVPLQAVPGSTFAYGGVSMHVAGAVCEVAAGQPWVQLFDQRVAAPLQMTATDFYAFGVTQNPRIAGGARADLRDYAVFVDMLRAGGAWNGVRVLSAAAVETMLEDQTSGLPVANTPHPENAPYGIGIWLDRRDSEGRTLLASGVGAFGFTGWVDRAHDATGVFLVQYLNQRTAPFVDRVWQEIDAALLPPGVACLGTASPPCAGGTWLNGTLPARAGNLDFALLAARAPVLAPGSIVLGPPLPAGLPIADLVAFVGPAWTAAIGVVADAGGRAQLPAPLSAMLAGQQLGVQSVWLSVDPCTALSVQASHALVVDLLP